MSKTMSFCVNTDLILVARGLDGDYKLIFQRRKLRLRDLVSFPISWSKMEMQ